MHQDKKESAARPGAGIRVASFFSGGGGLDLGFHGAGFEIAFATDLEPQFCETLRTNTPYYFSEDALVLPKDIRRIVPEELPSRIDFVIGGPPCQTFSASGRRAGGAAGRLDARGSLVDAYVGLIQAIRPRGFLFENVRGILGTDRGQDWTRIVALFESIGYGIHYRILDACDYGIPQHRERMFLVGTTLNESFLFPEPTHGPDSPQALPHMTPREAFIDVPVDEDLGDLSLRNGKYAHLLEEVPPGQNYLHFTAMRGYPKPIFAYRSRFSDFLYKADPDQPTKTLIARPGKYTGPFHWDNRRFSVAEYKRLQGFPDGYTLAGNRSDQIMQIGNSVSPKIARHLALAVAKQIFHRRSNVSLLAAEQQLSFDSRKGRLAKQTRSRHLEIERNDPPRKARHFEIFSYDTRVEPIAKSWQGDNVEVRAVGSMINVTVRSDDQSELFAAVRLKLRSAGNGGQQSKRNSRPITLNVSLYGSQIDAIQTMWNAIDDWVIRSSNFHSLFELYGHFTEPHPIFEITQFERHSDHPVAKFAEHISDFANCSKYLPKSHLVSLFGSMFGANEFNTIATELRKYRFDIRSHETNVAIPSDLYMIAYPFTLPSRRQMNFRIKVRGTLNS